MSARSIHFLKRVGLVIFATGACWFLLFSVPAARQVEQSLQQGAQKISYPLYQNSSGTGTHAQPYVMSRFQEQGSSIPPFIVATGADLEKIFDSDPLSPSDYAVLLHSMKNAGVTQVMIASPLAWHQADPFALDALELVIAETKNCVTSAPVSRAAQADPLPPAFVRASIPLNNVRGDSHTLPQVNRLAIADTLLGRENSRAGFSVIESESATAGKEFLLARWGDRVIFSSVLLAVCMREQIDPTELVVDVGQSISLPSKGYSWAIDEFGRTNVNAITLPAPDMLAPQLIRPEPEDFSKLQMHFPPVHVMQQTGEDANMLRQLPLLKALYSAPRVIDRLTWHRLAPFSEMLVLALLAILAVVIAAYQGTMRIIYLLLIVGWWILTLHWGATWIPVTPIIVTAIAAWLLSTKSPHLPAASASPLTETSTLPSKSETITSPQPASAKKSARKRAKKSSRSLKKS